MSRRNGGIVGPTNTPVGGLFKGVAGGVWRMNDVLTFVSNNQWPSGPESIDNSCRFDDGSSDNLSLSVTGTSQSTTGTISFWFKRANISADQRIFVNYIDANNYGGIKLQSDDKLEIVVVDGGSVTGKLVTSQVFRDVSAWYHCVVAIDSSNSTAGDRMRLYINGSEVTSFGTDTNPSSSATMEFFTDGTNRIGQFNSSQYFDGYLAEFVMIHGQQLTPTSFGETDSTTGIWKPKQIGSFTSAGDNSFYLDFKDSSNLGNDASGLNNDFTVNNLTSLDQVTDIPTNNFATLNSLSSRSNNGTFSEGNTKFVGTMDGDWTVGTMAATAGKWYWEVKANEANYVLLGITTAEIINDNPTTSLGGSDFMGFRNSNNFYNFGTLVTSSYSYSDGDIFSFMLDLDTGDCEFYQNDTLKQTITLPTDKGDTWIPIIGDTYDVTDGNYNINFGNPSVAISSGNSDPDGHGNFEYTTKTGYAWNTTNLNTYG